MMKDVMVDIETLGVSHNAVIVQIGAVHFDRATAEVGKTFCVNIQAQDCIDRGLTIDASTLEFWWNETNRTFLKDAVSLHDALFAFQSMFSKDCVVWSHSTFDIPIIANAYKVAKMKMPFSYRSTRDIRTLVDLSGAVVDKNAVKTHNAMEDCIRQVKYCCEAMKLLRAK